MTALQSKIVIAFGRFRKSQFPVPNGTDILVYDKFGGTVDIGIIDDIVNKLANCSKDMEKSAVSKFKDVSLFNRELTAASNIYQRVYTPGKTMLDMDLLYQDAPFFQKTVCGIYIPEKANIFVNENETPFPKGFDVDSKTLISTSTTLSGLIGALRAKYAPTVPLRLYVILNSAS